MKTGSLEEYKIAMMEADDFLCQTLEDRGFKGESFEELIKDAGQKVITNLQEIMQAHNMRNAIVYNQDYDLSLESAKNILSQYEQAIKNASIS